ncbi:hypothetical protein DOK_11981 [gamma proteobacterium BDW918]|nr:hypothetical protein DOK_11981 [gamma proteobacterium BDW918]
MLKNLNIDVDAVTFKGLSSHRTRMIFLALSLFQFASICIGTMLGCYLVARQSLLPDWALMAVFSALLLEYILRGKTTLRLVAAWLVDAMPMSLMLKRDKAILDRGRIELERVLCEIDLDMVESYTNLNPQISPSITDTLKTVALRGRMNVWLKDPRRLASAANLMYQVYITEEFVSSCQNGGESNVLI